MSPTSRCVGRATRRQDGGTNRSSADDRETRCPVAFPFDDPDPDPDPEVDRLPPTLTVDFTPSEPWVLEFPDGTEHLVWEPFGFCR